MPPSAPAIKCRQTYLSPGCFVTATCDCEGGYLPLRPAYLVEGLATHLCRDPSLIPSLSPTHH